MYKNHQRHIDAFSLYHISDFHLDADEIINHPDKHLLTQNELFAAQGGYIGLIFQTAGVVGGLAALSTFRPTLLKQLTAAKLTFPQWATLGGTAFASHYVAQSLGTTFFGDSRKVSNHWQAYTLVKTNNRFDGRQILSKKPKYY